VRHRNSAMRSGGGGQYYSSALKHGKGEMIRGDYIRSARWFIYNKLEFVDCSRSRYYELGDLFDSVAARFKGFGHVVK
jgi:hypothetical protein